MRPANLVQAVLSAIAFMVVVGSCPGQILASVHSDLLRMSQEQRLSYRYLRLDNKSPDDREKIFQAIAGHMQHLSTASDLPVPQLVPGTKGMLIRVNIDDYYIDRKLWERLADVDPYDHIKLNITEPWPGGVWPGDNIHYAAGSFTYTRQVAAFAPAETQAEGKMLLDIAYMTRSRVPILRADWFFNQTAAQQGRSPGYYDFLGIKDKKSFEALIGFDANKIRRKIELREAVSDSGVTTQPRALAEYDADEGGVYYYSIDFKKAVDKKNPLRVLGKDIESEPDAFETYGRLPNGFWATGAFNGKGVRQDVAPGDIANDHKSKSNDKQVHVNISCTRCHENGGLKDVEGWAKNLFTAPLALTGPDYNQNRLYRQQYLRDLQKVIQRDRKAFEEVCKEATGLTAKEYAKVYSWMWESYEDAKVDLALASKDLYAKEGDLRSSIQEQLKQPLTVLVEYQTLWTGCYASTYSQQGIPIVIADGADVVLSALTLEGPRRRTIPMRQWEEAYFLAKFAMKGARP